MSPKEPWAKSLESVWLYWEMVETWKVGPGGISSGHWSCVLRGDSGNSAHSFSLSFLSHEGSNFTPSWASSMMFYLAIDLEATEPTDWGLKRPKVGAKINLFFPLSLCLFLSLFCSTGIWTQGLHLEHSTGPIFVMGFFFPERGSCLVWLLTVILLISISWVAWIIGVSHWCTANFFSL
jgi:hypothetical protein